MLVLGIEMELLTLISITLMVLTAVTWLCREWSWYSYQYKAQQNIAGLQEANEHLYLRLQIEEAAQPQCASNLTEFSNSTATFSALSPETSISNALIYPAPVFFDGSGFLQLFFFTGLILLEYYFMHTPHLSLAGDNPTEQGIKREVQDFLLKKHPISNILVFTSVAFLSLLAWWNLLPRITFLDICFKVLMALAVSSPIAFVVHNLMRVKQYFPTDAEAWQKAVKDYTWWIWLCSRLIGAYDMRTATKTALWLFCVLWYVWPVRYFFYYRYISCTPTEAMTGCIHSVGVSNTCNTNMEQLFETNNVFYINMLCQGALLMMCCNIAYLLTMLKALNMPHSASRDAKKNQDSMGIDSTQYGLIGALLRRLDHPNALALLSLFSLLNSLLAVLRVVWFVVFTSCSWYAVMIACMFTHMHLGVTMYALPSVNALMQKYSTIDTYRDIFVEQFRQHQQHLRSDHNRQQKDQHTASEGDSERTTSNDEGSGDAQDQESTHGTRSSVPSSGSSVKSSEKNTFEKSASEESASGIASSENTNSEESEAEDDDFTAQEVFNKVLTDSVLYYLFVNSSTKSEDSAGNKGGEKDSKEDSGSKLSVVFQAFLQTAAFSYQNQPEEGAEADSGRSRDEKSGKKEKDFTRHDHYD